MTNPEMKQTDDPLDQGKRPCSSRTTWILILLTGCTLGFGLCPGCESKPALTGKHELSHSGRITAVAFSSDGKHLAVGTKSIWSKNRWQGQLTVWDGKTFTKRLDVSEEQWVNSVAFSPDGKILALGLGCYNDTRRPDELVQYQSRPGLVKLYDTSNFKVITTLKKEWGVSHVAFSPVGKTLAVAGGIHPCERPGRVELYDTDTWKLRATLTGHRFGISAMDFSPNGEMLATGDAVIGGGPCPGKEGEGQGPGEVRLWSINDAKQVKVIEAPFSSVLSIGFSPDGRTMAIGGIERAGLIDVETGQQLTTAKFVSHYSNSVAFSSDGELLAISSFYSGSRKATEVGLWNVATGKKIASFEDDRSKWAPNPMAFSPDGKFLVVAIDSKLRVLSVPSK